MNAEISVFGVFVPSIVLFAVLAYAMVAVIARTLRTLGVYRYVWHASLFNLAMFVCLLGGSVLVLGRLR